MKGQIFMGKYENYQPSDHPSAPLYTQPGVKLHGPLCTTSCVTKMVLVYLYYRVQQIVLAQSIQVASYELVMYRFCI